ncbi:MAG: hypothetical protein KC731_24870 [Myxococcales bacterium]|nr:hypothetical protein [Myxococcales bacterium]
MSRGCKRSAGLIHEDLGHLATKMLLERLGPDQPRRPLHGRALRHRLTYLVAPSKVELSIAVLLRFFGW